jgi:hypothetical protein
MTHSHSATLAAAVGGLAGSLLLVACGSSSPAATADTRAQSPHQAASGSVSPPPSSAATSAKAARTSAARVTAASACTLITEQDVTTAVGVDPGVGTAASRQGDTACTYGGFPKPVLTVNVVPVGGRAGYARFRQDPHVVKTGLTVANVSGLGDESFEVSGPHTDAIYFTAGDVLVVIGLSAPTLPTRGAALALAKVAAGHL